MILLMKNTCKGINKSIKRLKEDWLHGMYYRRFSTSFIYAASPSVVTTVWNIEDNSKANFMNIFYGKLKKNEGIADSLRATQNEMIKLGYTPFDWAAFTLTGKY
jgi:CHAT domain-containing protein